MLELFETEFWDDDLELVFRLLEIVDELIIVLETNELFATEDMTVETELGLVDELVDEIMIFDEFGAEEIALETTMF